jgi:putative ABC transport system ATP-binding protein
MNDLFTKSGAHVTVRGLKKSYAVGNVMVEAVRGVDLHLNPGEPVVIVGESGCGKTTLLNVIAGIDKPDEGALRVGAQVLDEFSERELEQYRLHYIGFVFQMFNLIPAISAIENVEFPMSLAGMPAGQRRERASRLLDVVGMLSMADKKPDELSGGQQQRVAIAVALANDPAIILADEPTANLDAANVAKVSELIFSLAVEYGKTLLIATHDPRVAARVSDVRVMEEGQFRPRPADVGVVHTTPGAQADV